MSTWESGGALRPKTRHGLNPNDKTNRGTRGGAARLRDYILKVYSNESSRV